MTTDTLIPEIPTPQPIIDETISPKQDIPGVIPTSYAGYPGAYYIDPVTKKSKQAVPSRFIETMSYVGQSTIHGLGCFSKTNIVSGQFIEECSAILLDTTTKSNKDYVMTRYLFTWPCDQNDPICNENGPTFFVPTGNAMIYNHSDTPNSYWIYDKAMKRLFLSALRNINEGEELTWYYGHGYAKRLRNDPSGEGNSKNPNIPPSIPPETNQNKGCSSCEERRRQIEQNNKINNPEIRDMPVMPRPYRPVINRSKFYKNMPEVTPTTTETLNNTTAKEELPINFRSMVVPENKINDTIQDGSV